MKLDDRILDGEGLVEDFALAAEERFIDAQALLALGHGTGAAYVGGYVAEMLLKNAVFLFDGARPSDEVYPRLAPVKKWASKSLPGLAWGGYHDVWAWAHVLRKKRIDKGRPLADPMAQNLLRIAYRLSRAWSVELRYFGFAVGTDSARRLLEDVAWIKKSFTQLWR